MPSVFTLSGSPQRKLKSKSKRSLGSGDYGPDELKLTMDNDGTIYRDLQNVRVRGVAEACREGGFSVTSIGAFFLPLVKASARQYESEFGTGFSATEQLEVAHEYANELKHKINNCYRNKKACGDLPSAAVPILKSCKIPSTGFAGVKRRAIKRR